MPTRFTGQGPVRRPAVSERQSTLDTFIERLADLGATDDELLAVRASWPSASAEEREYARHVTDVELTHELRRVRGEYVEHTQIDGGGSGSDGATDDGSPPPSLPEDVRRVVDVLEWVNNDPERAAVALDVEWARDASRVTLIEQLEGIIGAASG